MRRARYSMRENQGLKRRKERGFCSRVSTIATGRGVRSCVPPRSGTTGSGGGGTGTERGDHSRGEGISVRLRGMDKEYLSAKGPGRLDLFRIFFQNRRRRLLASIVLSHARLR